MSSFHEEALWVAARTHGVSLFGAGRFARDVAAALAARGVRVHGFLVSGVPGQPTLDDLPVRQITAENLAESPVWVGVFNREAHSDYAALAALLLGVQPEAQLVWPQAYYGALAEALGFRFWLQPLAAYQQPGVQDAIAQARELLADAPSRQAFDAVLAFRTDPQRFMCPPQPQDEVQYLPTWLRQTLAERGVESLRLVDGGAYRGETVRELGALIPIAQAWTFEPDAENYAHLVRNLADWPTPITHIPAGLSDTAGSASFTSGMGEASSLGAAGTHRVPVVGTSQTPEKSHAGTSNHKVNQQLSGTPGGKNEVLRSILVSLDECVHRADINFIKFDLEGHEMPALQGSRRTLAQRQPVMSIAGYHRWDDLWRIPLWLQALNPAYRLRLVEHAYNSFDAVIYAV